MEQSKQKKLESHGDMDDVLGNIGKLVTEAVADKPIVTEIKEKAEFEPELLKKLGLLKTRFGRRASRKTRPKKARPKPVSPIKTASS